MSYDGEKIIELFCYLRLEKSYQRYWDDCFSTRICLCGEEGLPKGMFDVIITRAGELSLTSFKPLRHNPEIYFFDDRVKDLYERLDAFHPRPKLIQERLKNRFIF